MKTCGIYQIISPSKKIYIGQSVNIFKRWQQYKHSIKDKCIKTKLKSSFIKYGIDKHKFEVLCKCDKNELDRLEKYYINLYQTFDSKHGLNLQDGGNLRKRFSKETIQKMRDSHLGKKLSAESIRKRTLLQKGMKRTEETKEKIRQANIGKKHTIETREKMRLIKIGTNRSEKTKQKISKTLSGRIISEETKQKIRGKNNHFFGKKHTEETRRKMRKSAELRKMNRIAA